ncbi:hypothetical protein WR25_06123 [Diploscapter pachys]|uniref:EF-hand domain-containing protein n=1 Tax=Diploscapter pachys TaxID=2018661 RepID=A0A2A2LD79_9BILA|nr:hypothetical protein WR25_06123 [Diploscapter pachys]
MTSRRVSAWLHLLRTLGRGRHVEQVRQKSGGWTGNANGAGYGKRSAAAGGSILAMSTAAVCAYAATLPIKSDIFGESEQAKHQVHSDHKLTRRELRFLQFASVEYDDVIYMSPMDFIDSLTLDRPRERVYRRVVKESELKTMLQATPPFRKGDKTLFRRLEHQGLISYSEYIFLLTLLTKSKSAFKIAFLMFDDDESGTIEKDEFLTIRNLISTLRSSRNVNSNSPQGTANANADDSQCQLDPTDYHFVVSRHANRLFYGLDSYQIVFAKSEEEVKKQDTTLVLHLFGIRGSGKLSFDEFQRQAS